MDKQTGEPTCFGVHWEESAAECDGCSLSSKCQTMTENRRAGKIPQPPPEVKEKEEIQLSVDAGAIEHLLSGLEGRYDRTDEERGGATGSYFRENGELAVLVVVSKTSGRIKVQTTSGQKILDSLEAVEDAEKVLAELLG